jgi:hypothetical protein
VGKIACNWRIQGRSVVTALCQTGLVGRFGFTPICASAAKIIKSSGLERRAQAGSIVD